MKKRSKFGEFLYDAVGALIIMLIVFGCLFTCSDTVRSFTKESYHAFTKPDKIVLNPTDTVKPKAIETKDSVLVIKSDTTRHALPLSTTQNSAKIDTIQLIKGGDRLYYLPVIVNGIPMKFALDTGCSSMTISIVEYLFLERQGIIKSDGAKKCVAILANGETEDCFSVTLDSITVGKHSLKNVECVVSPNQDGALLLGQDVLSKLGEVTIKYNKQILLIE